MAMQLEKNATLFGKKDRLYYIHCVIGIVVMFGFGFIPGPEPITAMGMRIFGIFLGLLYLWSTCGLLWPSILGFVAITVSGAASADTVMKMSFGNSNVMMMIIITMLALVVVGIPLGGILY